jgi:hypothetical protein
MNQSSLLSVIQETESSSWNSQPEIAELRKQLHLEQNLRLQKHQELQEKYDIMKQMEDNMLALEQQLKSQQQLYLQAQQELQQRNHVIKQLEGNELDSLTLTDLKQLEIKSRQISAHITQTLVHRMEQEMKNIARDAECVVY